MTKKAQNFANESLYVLPDNVLEDYKFSPVIQQLYVTDLGFYPNAENHYINREIGTEEWILILCTNGKGTITFDNQDWKMQSGSVAILPPNKKHKYYSSKDHPWDIFWLHFRGKSVNFYLPKSNNKKAQFYCQNNLKETNIKYMMNIFWQMIQSFSAGYSYEHVFYVSQLLGVLLSYLALQETSPQFENTSSNEYVNKAIQYIYDNIGISVPIKTLSERLDISEGYLNRIFHKSVGQSINQFITFSKLKQAVRYLEYTNLPIQQIAQQVGYKDQFYFSRQFKKHYNVSPRDFRKKKKDIK